MSGSDTPTVHQALTAVMADVGVIGKNRRADRSMGGYAYQGIDDIRNRLAAVLPKHSVVIAPHSIDDVTESSYQTRSGTDMRLVRIALTYRIYGPGGDHINVAAIGEAADTSDKAATQAKTTAYKYLLIELLSIASEEERDADATNEALSPGQQKPSPQQRAAARADKSSGGPPTCAGCGEDIVGPCKKVDGRWWHKDCA